jgi:hypothetical protein
VSVAPDTLPELSCAAAWPEFLQSVDSSRRWRRELEVTGNAYIEVIRNLEGKIALIRRADPCITRIMRLGRDSYEEEIFSPILNTTVTVAVRRRRFVQYVFGKLVYFKEFNAPQAMNRNNGKWEGEEGNEDGVPLEQRANEIIHIACVPHFLLPYGIPRWIPQTPSVLGSRKAEEFNLGFFDQGGIPPMLIVIQGGEAADDVEKAIKNLFYSAGPQKTTAAVLQVQSTSGDVDDPGQVKVTVERFGCYSEDTEVLTENGWARFQDWDGTKVGTVNVETGALEFQAPQGGLYIYDYQGEMVHFPGAAHDALVTPNHLMVREHTWEGNWIRERADVLEKKARAKLLVAPSYVSAQDVEKFDVGFMSYPATPFLKFLGYFIADGSTTAYREGREHVVRITVKKERKAEAFRPVMKEVGACSAGIIERPLADDYTRFEIHDKNLRAWLRASVGTNAKNKHIPRRFLQLSTEQSQTLLLALFEGDAHYLNEGGRNSYTYTTASCQLADDVQELSLRCGWRATIGNDDRGCFYVSVVPNKNFASLSRHREKEIPFAERVAYAGKVYSLSVPNQTLITRRNGRAAVHSSANASS